MYHQPRKRFGQNFLQDAAIIDHIVKSIHPLPNQFLVEIGPGLGALTHAILPLVHKLHAIELDRDVIAQLKNSCQNLGELIIHQGDVLEFDFASLPLANQKMRVFGNLPYNISTPLLFHLLTYLPFIEDLHFMLQHEVVERIVAPVGDAEYSRLSVMLQYYFKAEKLFTVPPTAFFPQPKVTSAVIRLVPIDNVGAGFKPTRTLSMTALDEKMFSDVVKLAFSQRRKMLSNTLKSIITADELQQLGIDPHVRPQEVSVEQYVSISNYLISKMGNRHACSLQK